MEERLEKRPKDTGEGSLPSASTDKEVYAQVFSKKARRIAMDKDKEDKSGSEARMLLFLMHLLQEETK